MPITLALTPNEAVSASDLRDRLEEAQVPYAEGEKDTLLIQCADQGTADFWEERIGEGWGAAVEASGEPTDGFGTQSPPNAVEANEVLPGDAEGADDEEALPGEADTEVQPS